MVKHRKAAVITTEQALEGLNNLPFGIVSMKKGPFYMGKNFKRAPNWAQAAKVLTCLTKLLDHSGGNSIKHVCMRDAVAVWSKNHDLDLNDDLVDELAYSLRAIINQAMNMKQKSRLVPTNWRNKFACFYNKLKVDKADDSDGSGNDDDEDLAEARRLVAGSSDEDDKDNDGKLKDDKDMVLISDSDDNMKGVESLDRDLLFSSSNPVLARLLAGTRSRIREKSSHPEIFTPEFGDKVGNESNKIGNEIGGGNKFGNEIGNEIGNSDTKPNGGSVSASSLDGLEALAAGSKPGGLSPQAWLTLGKSIKGTEKTESKKRPRSATRNKKDKGDGATPKLASTDEKDGGDGSKVEKDQAMSWDAYVKREHSKVYHSKRKEFRLAGFDDGAAKARASEAGRNRRAELRALRDGGNFAEYV
jgi:hypothetical protein